METGSIDDLLSKKILAARRAKKLRLAAAVVVLAIVVVLLTIPVLPHGAESDPPVNTNEVRPTPGNGTENDPTIAFEHEIQLVWFGDAGIPDELSVTILHGKKKLFAADIKAADGWRYAWTDEYSAEELALRGDFPDGMTVQYAVSGENFTVTATCSEPERLPQTGMNAMAGPAIMLAGLLMLAGTYRSSKETE